MPQVKISVIVPVYNVEKFLPECLDSLKNQTLYELEFICVNDGSPDNSLDILNRYAAEDERFIIVSQENGGLSAARNTGLKYAKGDYIYFIDSDDLIAPEHLENMYNAAVKEDADMVVNENFVTFVDTVPVNAGGGDFP
ncbi:MAG: glycosyltransferase [Fusobacterium sp.]|nr:glycosyltransferase [Fusobacterium sp.]